MIVLFASVSLMKPIRSPFVSDVAGLPTNVPATRASCSVIGIPLRLIVIVVGFVEKHGPDVDVTGGTYGRVVPGSGARQGPVVCTVAVPVTGACVPGRHDVDPSGAVQFAK